jgi:hypothetical protein
MCYRAFIQDSSVTGQSCGREARRSTIGLRRSIHRSGEARPGKLPSFLVLRSALAKDGTVALAEGIRAPYSLPVFSPGLSVTAQSYGREARRSASGLKRFNDRSSDARPRKLPSFTVALASS